ncbi:cytochrome P450 [Thozetella sp. PMI_491]|nr:cytochrome P450 [Thozetella sp. PMI_491]
MLIQSLLVALLLLGTFLWSRVKYFRFKQHARVPSLPTSLIWGHMTALVSYIKRGDPNRHIDIVLNDIKQDLGNPPIFLLDLRPVAYPMCVVANHEVAEQISRSSKLFPWSTPKSPTVHSLVHLIGRRSILLKQDEDWKTMRKRFNPGFAPSHLMLFLPTILDKTWLFLEQLDSYARTGEAFSLEKLTINLTFDIIGAVVMEFDFNAQHAERARQGQFIQLYDELITSYPNDEGRVPWWLRPREEWKRYRLGRQINALLTDIVRAKFAEMGQPGAKKSRSVLSLSLQDVDVLTDDILQDTCDQLKTFLFAGHDTTSILLCWAMYELSRTPAALAALRAELDDIFGPDPDPATIRARLLSADGDDLVRRMTYASAVIKEILRLHPPGATARMAPLGSNCMLRMPSGEEVCVDGMVIYNCAYLIQRDPAVFGPTADDFVPERWLGDTDTSMEKDDAPWEEKDKDQGHGTVPKGAWRPFERGPRNCIGQELANIEARVILAVVARRYDFVKVGVGKPALDAAGAPVLGGKGQYEVVSELYNTRKITAKPVDGTMMKVRLTRNASRHLA